MSDNKNSTHILVTGGAGYIGSACVHALLAAGYQVTVFDDLSTGQRSHVPTAATLIVGDITDQRAVEKACGSAPFSAVIHLAAKKAVGESEQDPALYFQTNVVGSANLLAALTKYAIPLVIFSSTAVVYRSVSDTTLLREDMPLAPQNVYGLTKQITEEMITAYQRTGALRQAIIFRYFNVAGDTGLHYHDQQSQNIFPLLLRTLKTGAPFSIFGTDYPTPDGTCIRDYVHLADIVDAHLRAIRSDRSGVYNLASGTGYSVRQVVAAFAEISGQSLQPIETSRRPGDPACLCASAEKAQRELGWVATRSLEDMVRSALAVESE